MAPLRSNVRHKKRKRQKLLDLGKNEATIREGQRQNKGTGKTKVVGKSQGTTVKCTTVNSITNEGKARAVSTIIIGNKARAV